MEKTNLVEACEKAAEVMIKILNTAEKPDIRIDAAKALAMLTEASIRVRANAGAFEFVERLSKGDDIFKAFDDLFKKFRL